VSQLPYLGTFESEASREVYLRDLPFLENLTIIPYHISLSLTDSKPCLDRDNP